jgi:hypothetical protein
MNRFWLPYLLLFFILEAAAGCRDRDRSNVLLFFFVCRKNSRLVKLQVIGYMAF